MSIFLIPASYETSNFLLLFLAKSTPQHSFFQKTTCQWRFFSSAKCELYSNGHMVATVKSVHSSSLTKALYTYYRNSTHQIAILIHVFSPWVLSWIENSVLISIVGL